MGKFRPRSKWEVSYPENEAMHKGQELRGQLKNIKLAYNLVNKNRMLEGKDKIIEIKKNISKFILV